MNLYGSIKNNLAEEVEETKVLKESTEKQKARKRHIKEGETSEPQEKKVEEAEDKIQVEEVLPEIEEETTENITEETPVEEETKEEEDLDLEEKTLLSIEEVLTQIKDLLSGISTTEEIKDALTEAMDVCTKKEEEELMECDVNSYKVTRVSPKTGAYMIEAETKEGLKYIVGKNYNKKTKTLEEAEIYTDKGQASTGFKKIMKESK